jgi:hypothetical protein
VSKITTFLLGPERELRRTTLLLIAGAALLGLGSYSYLFWFDPSVRSHLAHPAWLGIILLPYFVCARIWIRPNRRSRAASLAAVMTAGILFFFAAASSAWRVFADWGTDMAGVFVFYDAVVTTIGVIVVSMLSYAVCRRITGDRSRSDD